MDMKSDGVDSSASQLYGQSLVPEVRRMSEADALSYLKEVEERLHGDNYASFLQIMKDFKSERIDTSSLIAQVKELFKGHNCLIPGLNAFLPRGFAITLDEPLPNGPEEAFTFLNKLKKRDEHLHKSFLDMMNVQRKENKEVTEVYHEVANLLEGHADLLEDFKRLMPGIFNMSLPESGSK